MVIVSVVGILSRLRGATIDGMLRRNYLSPSSRIKVREIMEQHKCEATDQEYGNYNRYGQFNCLGSSLPLRLFVFLNVIKVFFVEVLVVAACSRFFVITDRAILVSTASLVIRHGSVYR